MQARGPVAPGAYACPHCGRPIRFAAPPRNDHAAAASGALGGAVVGGLLGGPGGALIGGFLGLLIGDQADQNGRR